MSGGAALIVGIALGVVLLIGYAVSLLLRYRSVIATDSRDRSPAASTGRRSRLSRTQRAGVLVLFTLVTAMAFVGIVEGACRIAGFGGYAGTFREYEPVDSKHILVMTDYGGGSSYFFANKSRPASLDRDAFLMPKPKGTFRVMLVGGSAAKGFPYPRHLSAASFLESMLDDLMPNDEVEVINLGTTAVASYPVLGMLTESLDYDPDLVVVYCGNNEFYGAYGVASLHSAGRSPGSIRFTRWARSLGVTQFIESRRPRYDTTDDRTLMEAMVGQEGIASDHPMREDAARNLRAFVEDMAGRCRSARVPVIICTPPANERGLAPIGQENTSALRADQLALVSELLAETESMPELTPARAADNARQVIEIAPAHARAHWLLARALDAAGNHDEAAAAFARSVDLDTMPWRAPSRSVDAIREAADAHGAILCDLVGAFRDASPGGSIGWEMMDDHVHPSLAGQLLIARSIAEAVPQAVPDIGFDAEGVRSLGDSREYARRHGATIFDTYAVSHAMQVLGQIPFFERSNPQYRERFDAVCAQIESNVPPAIAETIRSWQAPPKDSRVRRPITGLVAMAMYEQQRYAEADPLFTAAAHAVEPYGTWELQYTKFALSCRGASRGSLSDEDTALAGKMIARGRYLIDHAYTSSGVAERYVGELHLIRGENEMAIEMLLLARTRLPEEVHAGVDGALVRAYVNSGLPNEADKIIQRGLGTGGEYAPYYEQMRMMLR